MIVIAGVELVTAADVRERWGDVRAARLRAWCLPTAYRGPLLAPVTVAQLAALTGNPVPPGTSPQQAARVPSPTGPANLYDWAAVVRADRLTAARGANRRKAA